MVAFRDFAPERTGFRSTQVRWADAFERCLTVANEWVDREAVDVVKIETLGGGELPVSLRTIRVWHRAASPKPQPTPEV